MRTFNAHNETENRLLRVLAYGEGLISKKQVIELSNRTMLSRYKTAGFLKQAPNAEKGVFQTTEKFKQEYLRQIDPYHKFSGSGSTRHSQGLNSLISILPQGAQLIGAKEIQRTFDDYKKHFDYQNDLTKLRKDAKQDLERRAQEMKSNRSASTMRDYNEVRRQVQQLFDDKKCCSTPDLQVVFDKTAQVRELIDTLTSQANGRQAYFDAAERLERALARQYEHSQVVINIEITTRSYGSLEIYAKETYSTLTQTDIIYIPAY